MRPQGGRRATGQRHDVVDTSSRRPPIYGAVRHPLKSRIRAYCVGGTPCVQPPLVTVFRVPAGTVSEGGLTYNGANCEVARGLFQGQDGVKVKFWCEQGRAK